MNTRTLLITLVAAEFAGLDTELLDAAIQQSALELDAATWGASYQRAVALLAAHALTLRQRSLDAGAGNGASGAVVARRAGDLQVSFGAALGVLSPDAVYGTTPYGLEFIRLRQQLGSMAFVAGV